MRNIYIASALGLVLIAGSVYYTMRKPLLDLSSVNQPVTKATAEEIKNEPLVGTQWVWLQTELSDTDLISTPNREQYVLTLDGSNLTSTTDCNGVSGSYTESNGTFKVTNLVATQKACKDSMETTYTAELSKAESYHIIGNRMYLYLENKPTKMVFEKK